MSKRLLILKEIIRYRLFYSIDRYVGILLCLFFSLARPFFPLKTSSYKKILVIKLSMMGDTILLVPALRALRKSFKESNICVLSTRINSQVLEYCPYIDELVTLEFEQFMNPIYVFCLLRRLRKMQFDTVIDFEQWYRISALISFFTFAPERIGFKTEGQHRHHLFSKAVSHLKKRHEVECFIDLLEPLGITDADRHLELWPQPNHVKQAEEILRSFNAQRGFLVMQVGVSSTGRQRQWPLERFAELGNRILATYQLQLLLSSSRESKPEAERLNALLSRRGIIIADLPLLTLFVLFSKAVCVITNNTGIMHLSAASGTRVLVLEGPIATEKWGPWGNGHSIVQSSIACSPCVYLGNFEYRCKKNTCMQEIKVETVWSELQKILPPL